MTEQHRCDGFCGHWGHDTSVDEVMDTISEAVVGAIRSKLEPLFTPAPGTVCRARSPQWQTCERPPNHRAPHIHWGTQYTWLDSELDGVSRQEDTPTVGTASPNDSFTAGYVQFDFEPVIVAARTVLDNVGYDDYDALEPSLAHALEALEVELTPAEDALGLTRKARTQRDDLVLPCLHCEVPELHS